MKKVDKIVLKSFLGPFILTMLVVVFILLTQHMLKYFDDLVGKDLGWIVLGQLIFYFAVFVTPFAFPLGVLLSSLMTFGNLGEHSELTAIKSGGISLPRTMRSIFIFIIFLTGFAFISNNYFVPKAALQAYSLMWDIKRKKPSLDLPAGEFYGGIENYRIRVEEKDKNSDILRNLIIYDHTSKSGNKEVTIADSGRMYTIMNDRYLKFELYNGHSFAEGHANQRNVSRGRQSLRESFSKVKFQKSEMVFDLSSFDLERTDKELFSRNRLMRNVIQIEGDIDSLESKIRDRALELYINSNSLLSYYFKYDSLTITDEVRRYEAKMDSVRDVAINKEIRNNPDIPDPEENKIKDNNSLPSSGVNTIESKPRRRGGKNSIINAGKNVPGLPVPEADKNKLKDAPLRDEPETIRRNEIKTKDSDIKIPRDSLITIINKIKNFDRKYTQNDMNAARFNDQLIRKVRLSKNRVEADARYTETNEKEIWVFEVQYHKIIANSVACIIMFLIGAPLGSIIKKGGLGFPVLVSILFFIIYYVLMIMGEKWAKTGFFPSWLGIWQANLILLPIGLFFLIQAQRDARLFDLDFYNVFIEKTKRWLLTKKWIAKVFD